MFLQSLRHNPEILLSFSVHIAVIRELGESVIEVGGEMPQ